MSDDQQKEISSNGAVERAEQRTPAVRHEGVIALAATAMGALALGAISIGVLAIGKVAIGELSLSRAKRRRNDQVEGLVIARLRIRELTIERIR
jgi:hypothetical protein